MGLRAPRAGVWLASPRRISLDPLDPSQVRDLINHPRTADLVLDPAGQTWVREPALGGPDEVLEGVAGRTLRRPDAVNERLPQPQLVHYAPLLHLARPRTVVTDVGVDVSPLADEVRTLTGLSWLGTRSRMSADSASPHLRTATTALIAATRAAESAAHGSPGPTMLHGLLRLVVWIFKVLAWVVISSRDGMRSAWPAYAAAARRLTRCTTSRPPPQPTPKGRRCPPPTPTPTPPTPRPPNSS